MSSVEMNVVGSESTAEETRLKFTAHIIKDIFDPKDHVISYGYDFELMKTLRLPEFGVEVFGLHSTTQSKTAALSSNVQYRTENTHFWSVGFNDSFFGLNYAELFISIGYNLNLKQEYLDLAAFHIWELVKDKGLLFIVDPGNWVARLPSLFERVPQIEKEIKRYTLFADREVLVYRK